MTLGRLINAYRKQHKVSVRKLAEVIGVNPTCLFGFERGKSVESPQLLKILKWTLDNYGVIPADIT